MKFLLYLFRWELSTFVLAPVAWWLKILDINNVWLVMAIGNAVGASIFYKVDKYIFKKK